MTNILSILLITSKSSVGFNLAPSIGLHRLRHYLLKSGFLCDILDLDIFENFMRRVEGFKVPVLGGIILLKSAGMARFMNKNVAGVFVPEPLIKEMEEAKEKVKTSIQIAARLIRGLKDMCQGVHIMAIGWEKRIPAVLDEAGL